MNQYTNRTVPGALDVMGIANASAAVTVNGQSTYRKGEYYQAAVTVANSSTNVFQRVTNVATLSGATNLVAGGTIVPMANQTFRYDPDGNLTSDGVFTYIWDHENRLLLITNNGMAGFPAQKITITYDSQGRRIRYVAQTNNAGTFVNAKFVRYVYDGWNLLAELNATNNTVINTYLWGADLSGTLQGAGGVGGLLAVKNLSLGHHAAAYDGNGNVVALVDSGTGPGSGTVSASYEFGPFGEVIRASGAVATVNPFRFSTKYQDEETALLYYGYRYYNVSLGRWLSRDPIQERGGKNLLGFGFNDSVNDADKDGRDLIFRSSSHSIANGPPVTYSAPVPNYVPPRPDPSVGWWVVGTEIQEWFGTILATLGIDHVDITFNGPVVYVGAGGGVRRLGQNYAVKSVSYKLVKANSGHMPRTCGLKCSQATDEDILNCLRNRKPNPARNCQGDIQDATQECCLKGFGTIVSDVFPNVK